VAEQSHKREMSEAVRADFERLRERRGRARAAAAPPRQLERVVLTPPQRLVADAEHASPPAAAAPAPAPASAPGARPSWLRSLLRRG